MINILKYRTELGLSQVQLGERSGVSQGYISDLERGEKEPTVSVAKKLAAALGIPITTLLDDSKVESS